MWRCWVLLAACRVKLRLCVARHRTNVPCSHHGNKQLEPTMADTSGFYEPFAVSFKTVVFDLYAIMNKNMEKKTYKTVTGQFFRIPHLAVTNCSILTVFWCSEPWSATWFMTVSMSCDTWYSQYEWIGSGYIVFGFWTSHWNFIIFPNQLPRIPRWTCHEKMLDSFLSFQASLSLWHVIWTFDLLEWHRWKIVGCELFYYIYLWARAHISKCSCISENKFQEH